MNSNSFRKLRFLKCDSPAQTAQPVFTSELPRLMPQPPPQRQPEGNVTMRNNINAVSASKLPRLPSLMPQPPQGIVTMRELARQNRIVLQEKSTISSRPQSVKLPPVFGSSQPRGLCPHPPAQRKTTTSVENGIRADQRKANLKPCLTVPNTPEAKKAKEECALDVDEYENLIKLYQDEIKKMNKEAVKEKVDHMTIVELKNSKLIERKQKRLKHLVERPTFERISRKMAEIYLESLGYSCSPDFLIKRAFEDVTLEVMKDMPPVTLRKLHKQILNDYEICDRLQKQAEWEALREKLRQMNIIGKKPIPPKKIINKEEPVETVIQEEKPIPPNKVIKNEEPVETINKGKKSMIPKLVIKKEEPVESLKQLYADIHRLLDQSAVLDPLIYGNTQLPRRSCKRVLRPPTCFSSAQTS